MYQQTTTTDFQQYAASRERAVRETMTALNKLAAERGHTQRVSHQDIETLMTYAGWRCQCCTAGFTPLKPLSAEHVFPLTNSRQGHNRPSNIRIVCASCQRNAAPKPEQTTIRRMKPRGQRPTTSASMRFVA